MTVKYTPTHFWSVVFARTGSALGKVMPRSILLLPIQASALLFFEIDCALAVSSIPRPLRYGTGLPTRYESWCQPKTQSSLDGDTCSQG